MCCLTVVCRWLLIVGIFMLFDVMIRIVYLIVVPCWLWAVVCCLWFMVCCFWLWFVVCCNVLVSGLFVVVCCLVCVV